MLSALRMASTLNKKGRSSNARLPGNSGFFLRGSPRHPAGASTAALGAYPSAAGDMRAMLQLAGEKIPTERGEMIYRRRRRPTSSYGFSSSISKPGVATRASQTSRWSIPDLPSRSSAYTPGVRTSVIPQSDYQLKSTSTVSRRSSSLSFLPSLINRPPENRCVGSPSEFGVGESKRIASSRSTI